MKKIMKKINKYKKEVIKSWKMDIKFFGFRLAFLRVFETLLRILRFQRLRRFFLNRKDIFVFDYLNKNYGKLMDEKADIWRKQNECSASDTKCLSQIIWLCWLDGYENAPPIVNACKTSVEKNSNGHPIRVITRDNYKDYVNIPVYIVKKSEEGKIGAAHFSDILRICLLEKYGGLWLDATIYCKAPVKDQYFESDFFTCKGERKWVGCMSENQWTTFCLGGKSHNILFYLLKEFFFAYWMNEECAIDYLFFDDAIKMLEKRIPEVEVLLKEVPQTNLNRDRLILRFADAWKKGCLDDLFESDTIFYKLGYREQHFLVEKTEKGEETVFSAFMADLF